LFVRERLAAVRSLLDDPELVSHPGVLIEREATESAYAQWARTYDSEDNGLFDLDEPLITALVDELPKGRAIDAACGTGRLAVHVAALGFQTIGVDSSSAMLERARERAVDLTFAGGELTALPFPAADADLVVTGSGPDPRRRAGPGVRRVRSRSPARGRPRWIIFVPRWPLGSPSSAIRRHPDRPLRPSHCPSPPERSATGGSGHGRCWASTRRRPALPGTARRLRSGTSGAPADDAGHAASVCVAGADHLPPGARPREDQP